MFSFYIVSVSVRSAVIYLQPNSYNLVFTGSKTNRSDSLGFNPPRPGGPGGVSGGAPIMGRRMSRNNSQSSSLLNNRLSLAEAAGPDALPQR